MARLPDADELPPEPGRAGSGALVSDLVRNLGVAVLALVLAGALYLGFVEVGGDEEAATTATAGTTTSPPTTRAPTTTAPPDTTIATTTTTAPLRPPGSVRVRVANGAGRGGLAAAGGDLLAGLGWNVTSLRNADPRPTSIVYHADGFGPEAVQVAEALGMAPTAVGPIPPAPEAPADGVDLLVVLGADTTIG